MLDRERADFFDRARADSRAALGPLRRGADPDRTRARAEGCRRPPPPARVPERRAGARRTLRPSIPAELADQAQSRIVRSSSRPSSRRTRAIMERYLEGEEIGGEELAAALEGRCRRAASSSRSRCGVATPEPRDDRPARPARRGRARRRPRRATRPSATALPRSSSRRSPTRSPAGSRSSASSPATLKGDSTLVNSRTQGKERLGQLLLLQGKEHQHGARVRRRRHRRRRQAQGDGHRRRPARRATGRPSIEPIDFPQPVMSFAVTPKAKGDEEKVDARRSGVSPRRIRRSSCVATSDGRAAARRHEPDPRRGGRRHG